MPHGRDGGKGLRGDGGLCITGAIREHGFVEKSMAAPSVIWLDPSFARAEVMIK